MSRPVKCESSWKASVTITPPPLVGVSCIFSSTVSELACVGRRSRKRTGLDYPISLYPSFVLTRKRQGRGGATGDREMASLALPHAVIPLVYTL